jgi:drug/metabolite transporter (DMT)-like permease
MVIVQGTQQRRKPKPSISLVRSQTVSRRVGIVIFVFMSLTAVDAAGLHENENLAWGSPLGIGCIVLTVTLFVFVVRGSPTDRVREGITGARWSAFSIAVVVIACGLSAMWAERGIRASAPASVYLALMALLFLTALGYSAQLKAIEPTAVEPDPAPDDHHGCAPKAQP